MSGPITVADVVFTEATPEQRRLSWELNGASWAPPMSIDEYIGREQTLSETDLSSNGGTRYYVLHPKSDPLTIVSACEVTAKRVLIADASSDRAREAAAYSIASVFTAPQHRGHGLASHLLRCVQKEVDGADDAKNPTPTECGALYSDIGRSFYTALGWKDFRSPQLTFKMEKNGWEPFSSDGLVKLLSSNDVSTLCDKDVARQHQFFDGLARSGLSGSTHIAFVPSFKQVSWHFARDAYVAKVLQQGREVVNRGATTSDGGSWLYWDHDLRENKLKVLRLVVTTNDAQRAKDDVKALLRAALAEARDWGLPKVLVWNPDNSTAVAAVELWREMGDKLQVVFDEREDGSIPSLRWKGEKNGGTTVWEDNEYFAWC